MIDFNQEHLYLAVFNTEFVENQGYSTLAFHAARAANVTLNPAPHSTGIVPLVRWDLSVGVS
tara:strand:- start:270 stop:455 length:186 start_codon:yes stop_codon:yes gene_type:complete